MCLDAGHDEAPAPEQYVMREGLCFSSQDMASWQEHPLPRNVKAFAWARDDAWKTARGSAWW